MFQQAPRSTAKPAALNALRISRCRPTVVSCRTQMRYAPTRREECFLFDNTEYLDTLSPFPRHIRTAQNGGLALRCWTGSKIFCLQVTLAFKFMHHCDAFQNGGLLALHVCH